jgi:uroporphyrinogen-III synthase
VAYRTRPVAAARLAPLRAWLAAGQIHAVAFASPSAVQAVAAALGDEVGLLTRVLVGAIGPTTAAALRAHGIEPGAVPEQHTGEGLAEALAARLR